MKIEYALFVAMAAIVATVVTDVAACGGHTYGKMDSPIPGTEPLPVGVEMMCDTKELVATNDEHLIYRYRFVYSYTGGPRYGWRYPLWWWQLYGQKLYGDQCQFDRDYDDYFYC